MNVPCPTCPWRKSSTVGGFDIPAFNIKMMRALSNTVPQPGEERDQFRPIMACHYSPVGEEGVCIGYAAVVGYTNLNLRMMAIEGRLNLTAIGKACDGLDLWPSFKEMLTAYEKATDANQTKT